MGNNFYILRGRLFFLKKYLVMVPWYQYYLKNPENYHLKLGSIQLGLQTLQIIPENSGQLVFKITPENEYITKKGIK